MDSYLHPLQVSKAEEIRQGKKFWGYLETAAFKTRYIIAAHHLRGCKNIIEIGGYRSNVITNFLTGHHDSVTVYSLDTEFTPLKCWTLNNKLCRVEHILEFFKYNKQAYEELGVVILGFDIQADSQKRKKNIEEETKAELICILKQANVVILETASENKPIIMSLQDIIKELPQPLYFQIDLDLSANEVLLKEEVNNSINPPYWKRTMFIFKREEK